MYLGLYNSAVKPIILLTIVAFMLTGNHMTADRVFFAVACFNTVLYTMLFTIPIGASSFGTALVAFRRIQVCTAPCFTVFVLNCGLIYFQDYLLLEEQVSSDKLIIHESATSLEPADSPTMSSIVMKGVSARSEHISALLFTFLVNHIIKTKH
jgi:hypothetical protein